MSDTRYRLDRHNDVWALRDGTWRQVARAWSSTIGVADADWRADDHTDLIPATRLTELEEKLAKAQLPVEAWEIPGDLIDRVDSFISGLNTKVDAIHADVRRLGSGGRLTYEPGCRCQVAAVVDKPHPQCPYPTHAVVAVSHNGPISDIEPDGVAHNDNGDPEWSSAWDRLDDALTNWATVEDTATASELRAALDAFRAVEDLVAVAAADGHVCHHITVKAAEPPPLVGAMHSVYLHGRWKQLTKKMTTAEKNAAADAVDQYSRWLNRDSGKPGLRAHRWWRDEPTAPGCLHCGHFADQRNSLCSHDVPDAAATTGEATA